MEISGKKLSDVFTQFINNLTKIKRGEYLSKKNAEGKAFTKSKKINFKMLLLYLFSAAANGQKKSASSVLGDLWRDLGRKDLLPTRCAIIDAKKKVCPNKIKHIVTNLQKYDPQEHHVKKFYGRYVYLADGSGVKVPRNQATLKVFGVQLTKPSHYPNAHIFTFCELGTNVVKSYVLGNKKSCEKKMLLEGIDVLQKGSIIVGDCGMHSSGLAYLTDKKGFFSLQN